MQDPKLLSQLQSLITYNFRQLVGTSKRFAQDYDEPS
jgi:hypothetical protein